jgi:hypothetical protein
LYLTRFKTYKIARPPNPETLEGKGPRQINTNSKGPYRYIFQMTTLCIAFYESNLSTVGSQVRRTTGGTLVFSYCFIFPFSMPTPFGPVRFSFSSANKNISSSERKNYGFNEISLSKSLFVGH